VSQYFVRFSQLMLLLKKAIVLAGLTLIILALAGPDLPPVQAQVGIGVIRVAATGSDSAGCGGAGSPCRTIQYALNLAADGDEVRVAAGTYTGTGDNLLFISNKHVTLGGGYSTSDWNTPNPTLNVTIIDGQNVRRGIRVVSSEVTLTGFTIRNGYAQGANDSPDDLSFAFGGGFQADHSTVTLNDVTLTGNTVQGGANSGGGHGGAGAGGGLAFLNSTAWLANVTLAGNTALGGAGSANSVRGGLGLGGGLYAYNSTVIASDLTVTRNVARAGDAPGSVGIEGVQRADGLGGGVSVILSQLSLTHATLGNNSARGGAASGKGGLGLGGGLFIELSTGTLTDATLRENAVQGGTSSGKDGEGGAGLGGGGFSTGSTVTLDRSAITGNTAQGQSASGDGGIGGDGAGGGLYFTKAIPREQSSLNATNSVVGGNQAGAGSGASRAGYAFGGGIFCDQTSASLTQATLAGNSLGSAGDREGTGLFIMENSSANLTYSIISDHLTLTAVFVKPGGSVALNHTLWSGNQKNTGGGGSISDLNPHTGAPAFTAPGSPNYDYHIGASSAAREKAAGSTILFDLDQQCRPFPANGLKDLGADEYSTQAPRACLKNSVYLPFICRNAN
jgi:hypothetical protein